MTDLPPMTDDAVAAYGFTRLDEHNRPVRCQTWQEYMDWYRVRDTRSRVALTELGDARVSTVFLTVDHGWCGGVPLWFETMVFWTGHEMDLECDRYATWEQAEAGHERMVERVRTMMETRAE